ncbi:MAG TPA: PD-(D/E)XK nuclease family protein, partial [Methylomirabilota bacterium]|nr:PD-(D/E)XK nuclease family protein [Methylomirabilota bacterium]
AEFIKEWSAKSATRGLTEFLDYLEFYEQAGGTLGLENEEDPRNAVKLMTVHAAKGLEFAHVFILRVNRGMFPANERPRTFEFPVELMKDEKPEANFHIQEERRLFYVALTRAQERLTITTLAEKRGKIPQFIEDILMDAGVKRRDILQMAPALPPEKKNETPREKPPEAELSLFPAPKGPAKIFSRVAEWAETFRPPVPVPLKLSPSAVENYRACPQKYLFSALWCLREGPRATLSFGSVMHTVVKRFIGELRRGNRVPFEEVQRMFETEWLSAGFEDDYQEAEYKKDGLEQLRVFHASVLKAPPEVLQQEKAFELPLDHAIVIAGRMDQINSLGGDAVEIVDYKTGKPKTRKEADKDLQLSLYALAAREVLGLEPAALVFHSLRSNDRCVTTRDAKRLDEAVQIVQETAADIRAGEFEPLPGSAFICKSCVYRPICPAHEEEL